MLYKFFWFSTVTTLLFLLYGMIEPVIILLIIDLMLLQTLIYLEEKESKDEIEGKIENVEKICSEIIKQVKSSQIKKQKKDTDILKWLSYF